MVLTNDLEFQVRVMTDLINNAPDLSELQLITLGEMIGRSMALADLILQPDSLSDLLDLQDEANDKIIKQTLAAIEDKED